MKGTVFLQKSIKKISTFTWFQEVRRDVVKYMLRMNDILITAKYESLPGRG